MSENVQYMAEIMSLSPLCEAVLPSPHDVASSSPSPTLESHPTHGLPRSHTAATHPRAGADNLRCAAPEAVTMTGAWPALVPHGGHWTFAEAKAVFPPTQNQGASQVRLPSFLSAFSSDGVDVRRAEGDWKRSIKKKTLTNLLLFHFQ